MARQSRVRHNADILCIFVHAGAGYHSVMNEGMHLRACADAAKAAMTVLKGGGTSVDAVEVAVKVLEDREITNAGYGSNLSVDGVVECDASVVDHWGRSGAVGAVAQIKNPISLARVVLDHSTKEMLLRRVPPNLLVGQGATDFAFEQGIPVLPYDALISPAAKERWLKWREDLHTAEQRAHKRSRAKSSSMGRPCLADPVQSDVEVNRAREQHHLALLGGGINTDSLANESSSSPHSQVSDRMVETTPDSSPTKSGANPPAKRISQLRPLPFVEASHSAFVNSTQKVPLLSEVSTASKNWHGQDSSADRDIHHGESSGMPRGQDSDYQPDDMMGHDGESSQPSYFRQSDQTQVSDPTHVLTNAAKTPLPPTPFEAVESPSPRASSPLHRVHSQPPLPPPPVIRAHTEPAVGSSLPTSTKGRLAEADSSHSMIDLSDDIITDTVGAIAIDSWGNMACGASSGGIGMKYRGRVGPAALVGVGAAVIPADPTDQSKCSVASVASGTGEHMATTMAANRAAERVYHNFRKMRGGGFEDCDEQEAMASMVEKEFMNHPSVKNSKSAGAIGLLTVKKTKDGAWMYFAHNTDSFALASMHADDSEPVCTMSRSHGNGSIAWGGRACRNKR